MYLYGHHTKLLDFFEDAPEITAPISNAIIESLAKYDWKL
jgi:hypothetical protein